MLDSTVVCRRALGCEWGGDNQGRNLNILSTETLFFYLTIKADTTFFL